MPTGVPHILNYVVVDDFGVTLNPLMLAGQVHGGAVQGIGQALMEQAVYDRDSGQLVTATLMDYALPRAEDSPAFTFETRNVPCKTNALGVKGAGEAGAIGSCPAVMNAIVDALWRAYRIRHVDMPATPERVWAGDRGGEAGAYAVRARPTAGELFRSYRNSRTRCLRVADSRNQQGELMIPYPARCRRVAARSSRRSWRSRTRSPSARR